jgi:hypothetical protein
MSARRIFSNTMMELNPILIPPDWTPEKDFQAYEERWGVLFDLPRCRKSISKHVPPNRLQHQSRASTTRRD